MYLIYINSSRFVYSQRVSPIASDGRLIYDVDKSPLCEYMVSFIYKLKDLPDTKLMNNVLENFTVLQVLSNYRHYLITGTI